MQLAPCTISKRPSQHSIYVACDYKYFEDFGRSFAASVAAHSDFDVHFHVFNPLESQLEYLEINSRLTYSYEAVPGEWFDSAVDRWSTEPSDLLAKSHLDRTLNAMIKGNDADLRERLQKTYFACVRFVRLAELYNPEHCMFAVDVDAIVRQPLAMLPNNHGFYIHRIHGKKARYLAGGIWLSAAGANQQFLNEYANEICSFFNRDYIYWGIDQDVLETVAPRHTHSQLPVEYIDWNMQPNSFIWTAKGTRKNDPTFQATKRSYD